MSLLDRILASKRAEIAHARASRRVTSSRRPLNVFGVLGRPGGTPLRLIAEVKMKSPSAGELSRALDAPSRALSYAKAGAAMVSVLCDRPFFDGSWQDLEATRARLDAQGHTVPLLAKEFILDEVQIELARDHGADAVLLIARILSDDDLVRLAAHARGLNLEPLVEISDEGELDRALAAEARAIGVNARDLDSLAIDPARAARVLAAIPKELVAVHLSGLSSPDAVRAVAAGRADAALVGEALMREDDPAPLLTRMVSACGAGESEPKK